MYCPKCGAELPESAQFCSKCGTQLSERADTKPQTQAQKSDNIPQESKTHQTDKYPHDNIAYENAKASYFKGLKLGHTLFVICSGIAVLYALFVAPTNNLYADSEVPSMFLAIVILLIIGVVIDIILYVSTLKAFLSTLKELGLSETAKWSPAEINEHKKIGQLYSTIALALITGALLIILFRFVI